MNATYSVDCGLQNGYGKIYWNKIYIYFKSMQFRKKQLVMLASFFFVGAAMLHKPRICPHFQLLPKSQSVYHLQGWGKEDEIKLGK